MEISHMNVSQDTSEGQPGEPRKSDGPPGAYLDDLRNADLPDFPMLFEGRIPIGNTICYARPGCGKSMFGAQVEEHVAWKRPMGTWQSLVHGDCLVIDYEGNDVLAASRSLRITPHGEIPSDRSGDRTSNEHNIRYEYGLPGKLYAERFASLVALLDEKAATGKPYVYVRIDTLNAFIGPAPRGMNAAEWASRALVPLNQEMMQRGIACLIMHHTNKGGDMSGSVVLSGSVNCVLEFERGANDDEGVIRTKKLRVAAEWEMACRYEDGLWAITEELSPEQVMRTGAPRRILDFLMANRGLATRGEIEANLNMLGRTIATALSRLKQDGKLKYVDRYWMVTSPVPEPGPYVQGVIVETWPEGTIGAAENPPELAPAPPPGPASEGATYAAARLACAPQPAIQVVPPLPPLPEPVDTLRFKLDKSEMDPRNPKTGAIKAGMKLMKECVQRGTARYRPSLYAAQPEDVDSVWEGRNKWSDIIPDGTPVIRLDKNAAYLSAANTSLPIGALKRDEEWADVPDRGRVGYHLVDVPAHAPFDVERMLGGPFAVRKESGRVWITTPTLRQYQETATLDGYPRLTVYGSYTAPSTEVLLRPWIDVLKYERQLALENEDLAMYQFVKFCYSQAISTMGDSQANWEIRRPDWMHIIRAQAYANLWRAARQAQKAGVTVLMVGNTDELWLLGDQAAQQHFAGEATKIGEALGQWRIKARWIQGADKA